MKQLTVEQKIRCIDYCIRENNAHGLGAGFCYYVQEFIRYEIKGGYIPYSFLRNVFYEYDQLKQMRTTESNRLYFFDNWTERVSALLIIKEQLIKKTK